MAIFENRLGADHPNTAGRLINLVGVLRAQGDVTGTRRLLERSLAIYEARLGAEHPSTLQTRQNVAYVLAKLRTTLADG